MGMFDDIRCKYPLPLAGANDLGYQTKDTDRQFMDLYEIREDGTLWHECYDFEDRSKLAKWKAVNPGKEPPKELKDDPFAFMGIMTRVNQRWEQVNVTGEIRFYTTYRIVDGKMVDTERSDGGWLEWSAYFVNGKLNQVHLVENRSPKSELEKQPQ